MKRAVAAVVLSASMALPAELPVKQVVLYKHGVGFFQREGRLGPGESARLDFDASEMNDMLKSLTVDEKGGGKITGLRYDSQDPLSRKLANFPFQIGEDQSLAAMLGRMMGARLELKLGSETVTGSIVNGRMTAGNDKQPERQLLTLLLDSAELRTVDLNTATGIHFSDPQLQQQFKDYLTTLAAARSKEKRSVYIDSTDAKERDVVAGYMIPAAVWKSSYRLILNAAGQPVLEGWAIVDNTTGEDWNKVQLSLVSGRPISFVSQLYAPKYVNRPSAELADDTAARPVVHEGAFATSGALGGFGPRQEAQKAAMAPARPGVRSEMLADNMVVASTVMPSSIVSDAIARELGDLFEYRIAQPVTIRKNESAMLPFLQQPIQGRKLLIYSDHSSPHPTNAAELTNSTGKTLDGGPITVYDGGAYGGEALMETLKASDKRLISYAVDLGTRITEAFGSQAALVREIHASRGVVTTKLAAEETRTYTLRNVDAKAKTLILEHPLRQGYTLLSQKAAEKTPNAYRFEIPLGAGASQEFVVNEERVYDQSYAVTNLTPDVLLTYVRNKNIGDAGRRQLQGIVDQKSKVAENDRALAEVEGQMRELTMGEERIRQNISSLNSVSGQQQQVQNYARQIDASEQQLAALRDKQAELQKRKSTLQSELNKTIEGLAF
jgi:hypothetical protein